MESRGWLYGLIIFLAQTCNPYYHASNDYQSHSPEIIVDEMMEIEEEAAPPPPPRIEEEVPMVSAPEPPPPAVAPPSQETPKIFKVVEEMPRFPGCEEKGLTKNKLKSCAQSEMLKFISKNVKYPELARENGIQGRAIIRFVVNENGKVVNAEILRDPGNGCGREALRVVNMMPRWIAGKSRGKNVAVYYVLPVSFKL